MNKIKLMLFVACLSFIGFTTVARAEIEHATLAAKVKSFDEKTVTCEADGTLFKVERGMILQKEVHAGDAVLITIPGRSLASVMKTATESKSAPPAQKPAFKN